MKLQRNVYHSKFEFVRQIINYKNLFNLSEKKCIQQRVSICKTTPLPPTSYPPQCHVMSTQIPPFHIPPLANRLIEFIISPHVLKGKLCQF